MFDENLWKKWRNRSLINWWLLLIGLSTKVLTLTTINRYNSCLTYIQISSPTIKNRICTMSKNNKRVCSVKIKSSNSSNTKKSELLRWRFKTTKTLFRYWNSKIKSNIKTRKIDTHEKKLWRAYNTKLNLTIQLLAKHLMTN